VKSATGAKAALHGRAFESRTVDARYYPQARQAPGAARQNGQGTSALCAG
jgi:hypothetical protein